VIGVLAKFPVGDVALEVEVDGLGRLKNYIVADPAGIPPEDTV
jgi:hypothetical protein